VKKQRGVVLILAMLIVVVVTGIAVDLSWRYNLSLTRSENRWHGLQAQSYMSGAEILANIILEFDLEEDQSEGRMVDSLDEAWAQPTDAFPTDEGWVQGRLEDAQGRFNINLLQARAQQQNGQPQGNVPMEQRFTASQKRFIRLLQTVQLEDGPIDLARAVEITEAVIDWVDVDQNPTGFGGAERDYYQQVDPPVTPPDLPMVSVSELRNVKGVTAELYQALLPLVVALPPNAKLNVNTIPLAIMRTLNGAADFTPLTEEDAQLLMEERSGAAGDSQLGAAPQGNGNQQGAMTGGFASVDALKNSPVLSAMVNAAGGLDTDGLDVQSSYFLLFADVRVGDQVRSGASLLGRANGKVQVLRRTDANF
jgi:general secretion pathway protein K